MITFLGTRGYTKAKSPMHALYSCTLIRYRNSRLLLDCGESWLGQLNKLNPNYIAPTHAHPDHAWGLKEGSPCPVYGTKHALEWVSDFTSSKTVVMPPEKRRKVGPFLITPYPVEHSTRCPTAALKIEAGRRVLLYAPDVVYIHDRKKAFKAVDLYIGDGATVSRPLIRKRNNHLIGHASIRNQVVWCIKEDVDRAIFMHCGSEVINSPEDKVLDQIRQFASSGIELSIAHDGMDATI